MPDDDYTLLVAFDDEAQIKWVKHASGETYYEPTGSFDEEPLKDIDLLRVEVLDILVFRDRKTKKVMYCPHWYCRRYC